MATTADIPHDTAVQGMARVRLAEIAAKLADVAAQLHDAAEQESNAGSSHGPLNADCQQQRSALATARHAYWLRRQRAQIFGSADLFGEPGWDILLDLYIAYAEGKQVSVSSACIGSASPATTGLRWLSVLAEQGLIAREADEQDQRRIMVRLTQRGVAAMERFLALARER